ncbi:MAG: hypothetical protein HDT06_07020 [Bacteroidales bacterium]|nr:hypothetical protein [Bacteroidales bacterium]
MIKHNLIVALRNLAKYKSQTIISVVSIGVSVMIFALISSIMFNISGDRLLKQNHVENAAVMYYSGRDREFGVMDGNELINHQYKTIEKIYLNDRAKKSFNISLDNNDPLNTSGLRINSDFLAWGGYESAITGGVAANIGDGEAVITRNLGDKLFGNYKDAVGHHVKVYYANKGFQDMRSYKIVDVLAPIPINDSKIPEVNFLHSDDFASDLQTTFAYLSIKPDAQLKDVVEELSTYMNVSPTQLHITKYEIWAGTQNMMSIIISRAVILFLYLFVLMAFASALRQWLQLFAMRHREMAIRISLGSRKSDVFALFMSEELISISLAFIVTIVCNLLAFAFIENNFGNVIDDLGFDPSRVIYLTVCCYLSLIIICAIANWYAMQNATRSKRGLAGRMKPTRHKLRNVGICIQIVISIVFLAVTSIFALGFSNIEQQLGIPSDKSRYEDGLVVSTEGMTGSQTQQLVAEIRRLESVSRVMNVAYSGSVIEFADSTDRHSRIYVQEDDDIVDFYDMDVHILNPQKTARRFVLVDAKIKEKMTETGEFTIGKLMVNGTQYDIAGWYDNMPFLDSNTPSVIITDPALDKYETCNIYILPKDGAGPDALHEVRRLVKQAAPEQSEALPKELAFKLLGEYKAVKTVRGVIFILLGISILTTVATVYSTITLDTRRRRKEMALRKINGAKSKDICKIFAKTYSIIMGIAIIIAVPISLVVLVNMNETFKFDTSPVVATTLAVLICVLVVFITLYGRIRKIMAVNPAEYLKD